MTVTFHGAARAELAAAVERYNGRAPGLGDALAAEVRSVVVRIVDHPEAGFPVRPFIRRRLLARFPYSVLYNVRRDRLRILAVMHHRREPDYWTGRL